MWLETAVVALVLLQSFAIVLLWRQRQPQKSTQAGGVPALMIVDALHKIEHRLSVLEVRAPQTESSLRSEQATLAQMPTTRSASHHSSASHYELAQHMAREGAATEQLMAHCGLSRHEAELVLRLYAKRA